MHLIHLESKHTDHHLDNDNEEEQDDDEDDEDEDNTFLTERSSLSSSCCYEMPWTKGHTRG